MNHCSKSAPRWLALFALLLFASRVGAQEQNADFKTLASGAAAAIDKLSKAAGQKSQVRVFDFVEKDSPQTELSHELALQFAASLQNHARRFAVLTPEEFEHKTGKAKIPADMFTNAIALRCYAPDLGSAVLIEGEFRVAADGVMLWVTGWAAEARTVIFHGATLVPLLPRFEELRKKSVPAASATALELAAGEGTVWMNPQRAPLPEGEVQTLNGSDMKAGYRQAICIHCPNPAFSQSAIDGKVEGTVLLLAEILSDGSVAKLTVKKGLVCGLTDKAIASVAHWTFKPATRPDGTPIAVAVAVEVTFRLY